MLAAHALRLVQNVRDGSPVQVIVLDDPEGNEVDVLFCHVMRFVD
jgi:hypothetical protein